MLIATQILQMAENDQIGSASKRRKLSESRIKSEAEPVACASNMEQASKILNLPIEIFQFIFDHSIWWLLGKRVNGSTDWLVNIFIRTINMLEFNMKKMENVLFLRAV